MSMFSDFLEGLAIFDPYLDTGTEYGADYEIFWVGPTKPMPVEAVARLDALGWFQPDTFNEDDGDEDNSAARAVARYDADLAWNHHT